jgi:hypothetical protein
LLLETGTVIEQRISTADLARAESGFLANVLGVRQIGSIDERMLVEA